MEPSYERVRIVRQELQQRASRGGFAMRVFLLGPVDDELQLLESRLDAEEQAAGTGLLVMSSPAARPPEQVLTERMAAQLNGLASDGRGWYRNDDQHDEIAASARDLLAGLAAAGYSIVRTGGRARTADGGSYDPVPDLAALLDGLLTVAAAGTGPDHHYRSGLVQALADLLAGPYARLRGGLRLDEPGLEGPETEAAIYRATAAEVRWAPYQEFGIPDPAAETFEAPPGPVAIGSVGYRGYDVIIYWERPA